MNHHVDRFDPAELERDLEACRAALGGDNGADPGGNVPRAELQPLWDAVQADLEADKGAVARLRSLPTLQRVALIALAAVVVTIVSVVLTPRMDLDHYPVGRMAAALGLLGMVTAAAVWRLLRPLSAPPPPLWASRALLAAGVLLPCALALLPIEHVGAHPGEGTAFLVGCGKCFGFGAVMGFPVLLLAFLSRRSRVDGAAVAALAGVAAGLAGNLALQVHCPITDPAHLLAGHALLIVALGVVAAVWQPGPGRRA